MAWKTTQPTLLARLGDPEDQAAWAEFDRRYGELIVRYCRSRGLQIPDAEDVRQGVLLSLSRSMPQFEYTPARGRFRSYLGTVVRNAIARHLRRPSPGPTGLDMNGFAAPESVRDDRWDQEWVRHHLRCAMDSVRGSFDARSIRVFDRLLAGDAVDLVAREQDMSRDAVHKVKQRIRDRLKALIALQIAEEDGHCG